MGRDEDAELVAGMARGDRSAVVKLYDRFAPTLLALGARMLGDRREAEDLLHDVILEAWQSAAQYSVARGKVSTWLVLRLRSRALDRLRSPGRSRTTVSDDPAGGELAPASGSPEAVVDRALVRRALTELPPDQRRVLELAYFSGLSSSEIAEELGISIGTVKSRSARAIAKLRTSLGAGGST